MGRIRTNAPQHFGAAGSDVLSLSADPCCWPLRSEFFSLFANVGAVTTKQRGFCRRIV